MADPNAYGRSGFALQAARRRSYLVGNMAVSESLKDKQARAKSLRLYLRSELKPDYGRIFELVAHHINSTVAEVEEFVIDDQKNTGSDTVVDDHCPPRTEASY
ncbi:hypothetical protein LSAT2_001929 [Lamellibrachia satsuma]|nr:hypothetical protein LSAT2_001929 [Lamellibrachia satsuma]